MTDITNIMHSLVVYHKNCPDGMASLWCFKQANPNKIISVLGCSPDCHELNKVNTEFYYEIYFLDLCAKKNKLNELLLNDKRVIIFDHHKTNNELLNNMENSNLKKIFDMSRSGCQITWDYFNNHDPRPEFLDYIGDRDLWKWELEYSKEICSGMNIVGYDNFDNFYHNWNEWKKKLISLGEAFLIKNDKKIKDHLKWTRNYYYKNNYKIKFIFCSDHELISDLGNKMCNDNDIHFSVIASNYNIDKNILSLSFRSNGFDVSQVAKRYGGGGHQKAAGCKISLKQFKKDFKSSTNKTDKLSQFLSFFGL